MAALAAVQKLATKSADLMLQLRRLWWLLDSNNMSLQAVYVPFADNLADAPSRMADRDDYQLDLGVFAWLD